MNGNRMKYASTPTYGMQKRGFMKKPAAPRQVSQTPDFSKVPDQVSSLPFQQAFQAPSPAAAPVPQQPGYMTSTPYYAQNTLPPQQPVQQFPFAAPTFVQPAAQLPPMQPMTPPVMQQPLGNSVSAFQNNTTYSGRAQGFVPPQQQPAPVLQPTAPVTSYTAPAGSQTMPPFGGVQQPSFQQQLFGNPAAAPQSTAYAAVPPSPAPQQPAFPPQAKPVKNAEPLDADKLWSVFLFGLLPLLFIPCLFVNGIWSFIRYIFIGAAVIGLGAMWYRQMYSSTLRLVISVIYVALCIGAIGMQMQASTDARQAAANPGASQQQQQTAAQQPSVPEDNSAAAVPTEAPTATPAPTAAGPSQAELRLELFMELWKVGNVDEMVHLVQPSWRAQQENAAAALFNMLTNRTPEDFTIEDISGTEQDNSRTVTMRATINKNTGKAPSIYRFMIMMVREGEEWYVNPSSLATNDQVKTTDENVVNNKNEVGDITPAPRTTVTPAPPASTLLYFNNGGNSYHMDPECPSVHADYLPFDNSFSYADLKHYMKTYNLSPCLKCGAPTNTLDETAN